MKRTLIVVGVMSCIVAAVCICFFVLAGKSPEPHIAVITSDGAEIRRIDLLTAPDETFRVDIGEGYNIVCVKDGVISVSEASCPDKICIEHGPLSSEYLPIICLPNRLIIELY